MPTRNKKARWLGLLIFIAVALTLLYSLAPYLNLQQLHNYYSQLQTYKNQHFFMSILLLILIYIVVVSFSLPGAALLTLLAGFLFGIPLGLIIVVCSATAGATISFTFSKWFGATWFTDKASGWIKRVQKGFQHNAFSYLLVLRLIPLFPFAIINIIPGLLNIRTKTFMTATFIGIIPGTFVYISLGHGLGSVLAKQQEPNLGLIFTPHIILPLCGLALLALLPTIYQYIKGKKHA